MKVLIIDNYDSFVYNLFQLIGELGAKPVVHRNDAIGIEEARLEDPDAIVLSPGPGHPRNRRDFGVCREILAELSATVPTLGVCLGHQGIAHVLGGRVIQAPELLHGKTSTIRHDGRGIFEGVENPLVGGRYHSLIVERSSLPQDLEVSASTDDGLIMALRHNSLPINGLQFHPESILTPSGRLIMKNFLAEVGS